MTEERHPEEERRSSEQLADAGAQLAGALAGAAIGSIGGPVGMVGGAAVGVAIEKAALAVAGRLRGREAERAGAALLLIEQDVRNAGEAGDAPRTDGFFDEQGTLRSDAAELLEAILRQAAAAHEERKVPYLAHLFTGVAFEDTIRAADAQFLTRVAGELTYRQLVMLSVFAHRDEHLEQLMLAWAARQEGTAIPDPAILAEIDDAAGRRLLGVAHDDDDYVYGVGESAGTIGALSRTEYSMVRPTAVGATLIRLARLLDVPEPERTQWLSLLHGDQPLA